MRIDVRCELPQLKAELEKALATRNWQACRSAAWHILVDAPWGWASKEHRGLPFERTLVIIDNPCPEYRLNLLERGPAALISDATLDSIVETLEACLAGQSVYPTVTSALTAVERETLKLIAAGYNTKEVAQKRGVSSGTVKNATQVIYGKLELKSRVQLAHYYYGNWHLLEGWKPPQPASAKEVTS
jgi:DNA-binding CsgD family transcriptional regulator